MKKPQKKPKGVIKLETPPEDEPVIETTEHTTNTFIFIAPKFGKVTYAIAVKDCDIEMMQHLIREYKRTHDLKSLDTVSVEPFIRWIEEDKGFEIDTEATEFVRWE